MYVFRKSRFQLPSLQKPSAVPVHSQPSPQNYQQQSNQKAHSSQHSSRKQSSSEATRNQTTTPNASFEGGSKIVPVSSKGEEGVHTVELGQPVSSVMKQHGYEAGETCCIFLSRFHFGLQESFKYLLSSLISR